MAARGRSQSELTTGGPGYKSVILIAFYDSTVCIINNAVIDLHSLAIIHKSDTLKKGEIKGSKQSAAKKKQTSGQEAWVMAYRAACFNPSNIKAKHPGVFRICVCQKFAEDR